MSAPLRPMTLGEILDRAFQIYRDHFWTCISLAGVPALLMLALRLMDMFWWKLNPGNIGFKVFLWYTPSSLAYMSAVAQITFLCTFPIWPCMVLLASAACDGKQLSASSSIVDTLARWKGWMWLALSNISYVLILPEILLFGILAGVAYLLFEVLKFDPNDPWHLGPIMFFASVFIGWGTFHALSAPLTFSIPVWSLEQHTVRRSLSRAWKLSKGRRWQNLLIRLAFVFAGNALALVAYVTVTLILYVAFGRSNRMWLLEHARQLALARLLFTSLAMTLIGPIYPIALTLLYYDQRIRREGLDIEWTMRAAGMELPQAVTVPAGGETA